MTSRPETAMLLAAGLGTRMRPLTDTVPKPLIEVAGRTLIDRLIDAVLAAGVKRAVVNVHWLADQLEDHLRRRDDIEIVISDERDRLLETGGALAKARPLLGDAPVYVLNTDALWGPTDPQPLQALADAYDPDRMDELLLLADRHRALGYGGPGDFELAADGRLARRGHAPAAPWAYAGVRILNPAVVDHEPVEPFSANRIWNRLLPEGRVHGLPLDRFWLHVGDPKAREDAAAWLWCHGA